MLLKPLIFSALVALSFAKDCQPPNDPAHAPKNFCCERSDASPKASDAWKAVDLLSKKTGDCQGGTGGSYCNFLTKSGTATISYCSNTFERTCERATERARLLISQCEKDGIVGGSIRVGRGDIIITKT